MPGVLPTANSMIGFSLQNCWNQFIAQLCLVQHPNCPGSLLARHFQMPGTDDRTSCSQYQMIFGVASIGTNVAKADPSHSSYAAQALAQRGTAETMNALSELFNSSGPSTRLMTLQSVAQTEAGQSLLRTALSDLNEAVSSAAGVLLHQGGTRVAHSSGRLGALGIPEKYLRRILARAG